MSIEVSTSPGAVATRITQTTDHGTYQLNDLTLDDVRAIHSELDKVIKHAEIIDHITPPWKKKPARRRLGQPGEKGA